MVALWLRTELRRRWKAVLLLAVLAGITSGLAMAAIDGARRSSTVLARVSAAEKEPDVGVLPSRPNFDWAPIAKLPEVEAIGLFGVTQNLGAVGLSVPGQPSGFPPVNQQMGRDVSVIRIDRGRPIDPHNPHEVVVTAAAVHFLHLHLGQTFDITGPTLDQMLASYSGQQPTGPQPRTKVRIVGISAHDSLWDRYLGSSGRADDPSMIELIMSPALVEHYHYGYLANALVRLRHGAADVARFRRDIARVTHDSTIPVRDFSEDRARFGRALTIEETALLLFALAVVAAGVVLVGQALVRLVQTSAADAQTLSGLGSTRRQAARAVAAPAVVVAIGSVPFAVGTMVALSPHFPIGLARGIELDLGVRVDWLVLLCGVALMLVAIVVGGVVGAWAAVNPRPRGRRRSALGGFLNSVGLPIPALLGSRMALVRERGRNTVPVRPALVAALAGVLGIVGAFTFRAGLEHAVGNVSLAGTTWQRVAYVVTADDQNQNPPIHDLHRVPGIEAAAEVYRTGVDVGGDTVSAWSYQPLVGNLPRVVADGRLPRRDDETAMGAETATKIGAHVGDTVRVNGHPLKVVGIAFLPEQEGHSAYDQGLWITRGELDLIRTHEIDDHEVLASFRGVKLHVPPTVAELTGADPSSKALAKAIGPTQLEGEESATIPSAITNLASVAGLPLALGIFLVVLAVGALGHALVSSVARRRLDLAVLRSIGVTSRQARSTIAIQATVVGVTGLLFGIPLGLLAGRASWRWVARAVPFLYVAPIALVAAAVVVPASLVLANLVAALPGRAAAKVRPAEILRAE